MVELNEKQKETTFFTYEDAANLLQDAKIQLNREEATALALRFVRNFQEKHNHLATENAKLEANLKKATENAIFTAKQGGEIPTNINDKIVDSGLLKSQLKAALEAQKNAEQERGQAVLERDAAQDQTKHINDEKAALEASIAAYRTEIALLKSQPKLPSAAEFFEKNKKVFGVLGGINIVRERANCRRSIKAARERNLRLRAEVNTMKEDHAVEIELYDARIEELAAEIKNLRKELDDKRNTPDAKNQAETIPAMYKERDAEHKVQLKDQKSKYHTKMEILRDEIIALRKANYDQGDLFHKQKQALEDKIEQLEKDKDNFDDAVTLRESKYSAEIEARSRVASIEAASLQVRNSLAAKNDEVLSLQESLARTKDERNNLQVQLDKVIAGFDASKNGSHGLSIGERNENEFPRLQSELQIMTSEREDLRKEICQTRNDVHELRTQLANMTNKHDGLQDDLLSVTIERDNLEVEVHKLRERLAQRQASGAGQGVDDGHTLALKECESKLRIADEATRKVQEHLENLNAEYDQLKVSTRSRSSEVQELKLKVTSLEQELASARIGGLPGDSNKASADLTTENNRLAALVTERGTELRAAKAKIASLELALETCIDNSKRAANRKIEAKKTDVAEAIRQMIEPSLHGGPEARIRLNEQVANIYKVLKQALAKESNAKGSRRLIQYELMRVFAPNMTQDLNDFKSKLQQTITDLEQKTDELKRQRLVLEGQAPRGLDDDQASRALAAMQDIINICQPQIQILREQVARLQNNFEQTRNTINEDPEEPDEGDEDDCEEKLRECQESLWKSREDASDMMNELNVAAEDRDRAISDLADARDKIEQFKTLSTGEDTKELDSCNEKLKDALSALAVARARLRDVEKKHDQVEVDLANAQNENNLLRSQMVQDTNMDATEASETAMANTRAARSASPSQIIINLKAKVDHLEKCLQQYHTTASGATANSIQASLRDYESGVMHPKGSEQPEDLKDCSRKLRKAKKAQAKAEQEAASIKSLLDEREEHLNRFGEQIERFQESLDEQGQSSAVLRDEIKVLQKDKNELKRVADRYQELYHGEQEQLKKCNKAFETQTEEYDAQIRSLVGQINSAQEERDDANRRADDIQDLAQGHDVPAIVVHQAVHIEELETKPSGDFDRSEELNDCNDKMKALQSRLDELEVQYQKDKDTMARQIAYLQSENTRQYQRIQELELELIEWNNRVEFLTGHVDPDTMELLKECEEDRRRLRDENEWLRNVAEQGDVAASRGASPQPVDGGGGGGGDGYVNGSTYSTKIPSPPGSGAGAAGDQSGSLSHLPPPSPPSLFSGKSKDFKGKHPREADDEGNGSPIKRQKVSKEEKAIEDEITALLQDTYDKIRDVSTQTDDLIQADANGLQVLLPQIAAAHGFEFDDYPGRPQLLNALGETAAILGLREEVLESILDRGLHKGRTSLEAWRELMAETRASPHGRFPDEQLQFLEEVRHVVGGEEQPAVDQIDDTAVQNRLAAELTTIYDNLTTLREGIEILRDAEPENVLGITANFVGAHGIDLTMYPTREAMLETLNDALDAMRLRERHYEAIFDRPLGTRISDAWQQLLASIQTNPDSQFLPEVEHEILRDLQKIIEGIGAEHTANDEQTDDEEIDEGAVEHRLAAAMDDVTAQLDSVWEDVTKLIEAEPNNTQQIIWNIAYPRGFIQGMDVPEGYDLQAALTDLRGLWDRLDLREAHYASIAEREDDISVSEAWGDLLAHVEAHPHKLVEEEQAVLDDLRKLIFGEQEDQGHLVGGLEKQVGGSSDERPSSDGLTAAATETLDKGGAVGINKFESPNKEGESIKAPQKSSNESSEKPQGEEEKEKKKSQPRRRRKNTPSAKQPTQKRAKKQTKRQAKQHAKQRVKKPAQKPAKQRAKKPRRLDPALQQLEEEKSSGWNL